MSTCVARVVLVGLGAFLLKLPFVTMWVDTEVAVKVPPQYSSQQVEVTYRRGQCWASRAVNKMLVWSKCQGQPR
jgi:hypothetical protein